MMKSRTQSDPRARLEHLLCEQYGISGREAQRQVDGFARHHRLRADARK